MCGIAGIYNLYGGPLPEFQPADVLETIRHRGPDDEGIYIGNGIFLGATRLAIIDPALGKQPVQDETGRYRLVMNGEIFDYDLLKAKLQSNGHRFRSNCDTEVAVHLIDEGWTGMLDRIDGQYAIAAYDSRDHRLLLVRDRMGICPLFYAMVGDYLVFGSEMKAIFATGLIKPEINPRSLDAVLTFGCVPAPHALFKGIQSLPPGSCLEIDKGRISRRTYWDIPYNDAGDYPRRNVDDWAEEFQAILQAACRTRLRADVPVGLYLSGGIDSAAIAALMASAGDVNKRVFSIGFPEPGFDESSRTEKISEFFNLKMDLLTYHQSDLAKDLPRLIYHGETPLVSTESMPLLALSELAAKYVKVVLSGEGSDEALGGYLYFRWEALKQATGNGLRRKLLMGLTRPIFKRFLGPRNPFSPNPRDVAWAENVFGCYPAIMMKFFYFRMMREMVYSDDMLARQANLDDSEFLELPTDKMRRWDQYNRTLYLSSRIFMTNHLLGSRGDRAQMANSIEGRYPFLDRRVQEFLGAVPPGVKTRWHCEKYLLRRAMKRQLPPEVVSRQKKPFLAPFGTPFVGEDATEAIRDLLSPARLKEFGYFNPDKVQRIVDYLTEIKADASRDPGESFRLNREAVNRLIAGVALTFVVSTQVLADHVASGRFSAATPGKNVMQGADQLGTHEQKRAS